MTVTAQNPVLPGCFPGPSVCRVGQDNCLADYDWFRYSPAGE